ncbi:MAG: galactose mutarotase [Bacteroidales bacterium]|nr:galactose mutarotase [Bacteroidales bacterium]
MNKFGTLSNGMIVNEYVISNSQGMELYAINYGGIITQLRVPDKHNNFVNVVLGYDSIDEYCADTFFIGALIGPCANRIAQGRCVIDGKEYSFEKNNGENHLHGGSVGFHKSFWDIEKIRTHAGEEALVLSRFRKDGEAGYPGNMNIRVQYTLTESNELVVEYYADTDMSTVTNFTQHSYFNLSGSVGKTVLEHQLLVAADSFLPVTADGIPIGNSVPVEDGMDLRSLTSVRRVLETANEQKRRAQGLDHCFVLKHESSDVMRLAAYLYAPDTEISLQVCTTQPAVQCYTGNFLEGYFVQHQGLCIETQAYTNAIREPGFPSVVIFPNSPYVEKTVYQFNVSD